MYNSVIKYLKNNGETDLTKFTLKQEGGPIFIDEWDYALAQPSFTQQEVELDDVKAAKCTEICALRDQKIKEDSLRYTEAQAAESSVMALTTVEDVEAYDPETSFDMSQFVQ